MDYFQTVEMEVILLMNFVADRFDPAYGQFTDQVKECCEWVCSQDLESIQDEMEKQQFLQARQYSLLILETLPKHS